MTPDLPVEICEPDTRTPERKLEQVKEYFAMLKAKWPNAESEVVFRGVPIGQLSRDEIVLLIRRELDKQQDWREEDRHRADAMYQKLVDAAHPPKKENQ